MALPIGHGSGSMNSMPKTRLLSIPLHCLRRCGLKDGKRSAGISPTLVVRHGIAETQRILAEASRPGLTAQQISSNLTDLLDFFADRLKVYLREKGARYDLIDAVGMETETAEGLREEIARAMAK